MITTPVFRKPAKFFYAGLVLVPNAKNMRVEMVVNVSDSQAEMFYTGKQFNVHAQTHLEEKILRSIKAEHLNLPAETYLARCNMERPSKGLYYGKVIVCGFIEFKDLHKTLPLIKMIELRNKIRTYVVESTTLPFSRRSHLRRKRSK